MSKYKDLLLNLINLNANKNGVLLLIDFFSITNKITASDKQEFLQLLNESNYDIIALLDYIPTIYHASEYLDEVWLKIILKQYVLANVITQEKANEIKTACGIS